MDDPTKGDVGIRITSDPDETQITRPDEGHARRVVELPLRLLFVSDLTPHDSGSGWTGESRLTSVDRHSFDALLGQMAPRLSIEVPNRISERPTALDIDLSFSSLKSFHPEQVARQVPALAELVDLRMLVTRMEKGQLDLDEFRRRLDEAGLDPKWAEDLSKILVADEGGKPDSSPKSSTSASRGTPRATDGTLDRLLDMVDAGDAGDARPTPGEPDRSPPEEKSGFMNALVGAVSGAQSKQPRIERTVAGQLLHDLDQLISEQLNAVFEHRAYRRLEASWRGLKFIVDRTNFRKNIRLDVLAVGKEHMSEALYHQVLLPEHRGDGDAPPLSAIVLDYDFDRSTEDMALLVDIAETGASLQVPVISSVDPSFFGVAGAAGLDRLPSLRHHLEGPEYIEWNKLRERDEARHLTLAVPPMLLREPYGDEHPVEAFGFVEPSGLWGGGALAVAVLMISSFGRTGWPTHIRGGVDNLVENLHVSKSKQGHIPLAVMLSEHKQAELADSGFLVLGCRPNRDEAYVAHAPTVQRPGLYESPDATDARRAHLSLPSQLFVSRAAQFLLAYQSQMEAGTPIEHVRIDLADRLRGLMAASGGQMPEDAVELLPVTRDGLELENILAVRLHPPAAIVDENVSLVMQLQIPQ